jgi:hypothetical protein
VRWWTPRAPSTGEETLDEHWRSGSTANRPNCLVYPDWHGVKDKAKTELATAIDLFPQFGMPSL